MKGICKYTERTRTLSRFIFKREISTFAVLSFFPPKMVSYHFEGGVQRYFSSRKFCN